MDRFFSITAYNAAQYCLSKYVAEMGWKTFDEVVIDVLEIYDSVIYPEFEALLFINHDLGYKGEEKVFLPFWL